MQTANGKKRLEDFDGLEFMAALEDGARRFNEECVRLGISRVIELDGQPVLYHPDGTSTPIPEDDAEMEALFRRHKVALNEVLY